MTAVKEIAEAIKLLADVVKSTRELAQAVKDGTGYLKREHPEAQAALSEMFAEMQRTVEGLASVTAVVTGFRFTTEGAGRDLEPARFNAYVIDQGAKIATLKGNIRRLRGSCEKIRLARDRLNELAGNGSDWAAMFRLFGAARRERDTLLASSLSTFYADDLAMIDLIERVLKLCRTALEEADQALGPSGIASPDNIGGAAAVLGIYASAFKQSGEELESLISTLEEAERGLS